MKHLSAFLWFHLGRWFNAKGMPSLAESCYRYAARAGGRRAADAFVQLGNSLQSGGKLPQAIVAYREAVQLDPTHARAWCALGGAQRQSLDMEAARSCYERALALESSLPQALTNLGEWWLIQGEPVTALTYFDRVLQRHPAHYEALSNRVAALIECDRYQDAEQAARAAIEIHPDKALFQVNLGNVLMQLGRSRPALVAFNKALELQPACEEAFYNRATLLGDTRDLSAAMAYINRQIALKGETAGLLGRLALAQSANNEITAAEATCRQLLRQQPDDLNALISLSARISERGDSVESIEPLEKVLALVPQMPAIYSNLLFLLTYVHGMSREAVYQRHLDWATAYEGASPARKYPFASDAEPGRRLKIGYVSGDFCLHPVGFLLSDVMNCHDPSQYEIHCYSHVRFSDQITEIIRSRSTGWHDVVLMPDDELAQMIHDEGIDILIDLSGHTAYNRLPVFISKPAPIQASWIGYFHSTGLTSMDYFITDPHTSPAGSGQLFSEIPLSLPHTRFCYSVPGYAPEVAETPCIKNGYVTFGSFNRLAKLVDSVVQAWAVILARVPDAKLLIKSGGLHEEAICDRLRSRFAAHGVAAERLILRPSTEHAAMLAEFSEIDIALDTFPFNGGMTTLETLWMGVPVVTIAGDSVVSRQTVSALANIGLVGDLAFVNVDAYVAGAVALANNPARFIELRSQIRPRMAASPLRQPEQFTRDLESLYRRMWQAWCRGEKLSG